jgi:Ser/Thr protein kinase RdoA (MazF antagonist)
MNVNANDTPYANLTPNLILAAIESLGFQCTGSLLPLNSYENRVYQIGIEDAAPLISKFYRPQRWSSAAILEEHEFSWELVEHELPVVAPLRNAAGNTLHEYQGFRFALFPRQGGRALELGNGEQLEWMGRFLGRLHAVAACRGFEHRWSLDVQTYGHKPYQFLMERGFIPEKLRQAYSHTLEAVLLSVEQCFKELGALPSIRLHGDCHAGNVLWNDRGPQIVDLDDCLMGPAIQDLWMLLSGNSEEEIKKQLNQILRGYEEFNDFNFREIHLIEALRTLRMIHYSAWLARRWEDPTFPLHFPWFNTPPYWEEQLRDLQEQLVLLERVNSVMAGLF